MSSFALLLFSHYYMFSFSSPEARIACSMASETDPLLDPQRDGSQRETESRCSRVVSALHYITTSTEIVIVAFMFYFAAFIPLLNQFIYSKVAQMMNYTGPLPNEMSANSSYECQHMNYSDPVYLAQQELQNKASLWSNLNTMVTLVPNFFSCIFLGGYSDLAGRKVAIVLPLIGALIKLAILIVISKAGLHVAYMFIGSFMDGVFGGTAVLITGCFSSIADITTNENRSFRIIILELCISVGVILSQILFGFIIKLLGYTWPFAILAALIFSLLIYVPLRVRETVTPSGPVPKCQSIYFTKAVLLYVRDPTKTRRRLKLIITILSVTILSGIFLGGNSVDTYRTMNSPFCWSSVMIGLFAGAKYTVAAVGTITLTKTLQPRLGDLRLVIFGCVSGAAYYIAFSFASKTWHLFAGEYCFFAIDLYPKVLFCMESWCISSVLC